MRRQDGVLSPTIAKVGPFTLPQGAAHPTVTVSGTDFVKESVARVGRKGAAQTNPADRATDWKCPNLLTVILNPDEVATAGALLLFVVNPGDVSSKEATLTVT